MKSRRPRFFPLASTIAAIFIIFFALISILSSPPPIHHDHVAFKSGLALRHRHESVSSGEFSLFKKTSFIVPKTGTNENGDLWKSKLSTFYHGCSRASPSFLNSSQKTNRNRYLLISTSGGLNQQRTGIIDAVVAAYILNATLVIPKLDQNSFWKDSSEFGDVFDVQWFISYVSNDVNIVKQLPVKGGKPLTPHHTHVPRKCTPKCYETRILPLLNKKHAVQLRKFDYRLSNRLDDELQKLRCRVNYHALKFAAPIVQMGKLLVERMRKRSGPFIALHLRFEPDMLAFTGCYYGGGEKERTELGTLRKRWKTLHASNPHKMRRQGRCPLTPEEVGLLLRALGFGPDAHLYVASGNVYGGEKALAPLKALFPKTHSKETLATKNELESFSSYSSRMAALDFIVCDESDVFVTNNNGNMAKILAGRRKYFGHKSTIRPNAKKLYKLFATKHNTTWEEFASKVRSSQIGFMGEPNEVPPGRGEFHENPSACICVDSEMKVKRDSTSQQLEEKSHKKEGSQQKTKDNESTTEDGWDHDVQYLEIGNDNIWNEYLQPEIGAIPKSEPRGELVDLDYDYD